MKTELTLEIEEALKVRSRRDYTRYALEVRVPNGIADFVTAGIDSTNHSIPLITVYEIKVSFGDYYHSDNGANFVGDSNYYVMPAELLDEIIKKEANGKLMGIGVITYKDGKLRKRTDGARHKHHKRLTLEQRFRIMDTMLMRAIYGADG